MSVVAHFFMSVGGSEIHERLAHFFIDFYRMGLDIAGEVWLSQEFKKYKDESIADQTDCL